MFVRRIEDLFHKNCSDPCIGPLDRRPVLELIQVLISLAQNHDGNTNENDNVREEIGRCLGVIGCSDLKCIALPELPDNKTGLLPWELVLGC